KLKYYCCHHEQAVSIATEAYARAKDSLGVSLVTTGPGATNALTGMCCSWMDSVPHLLISGQVFLSQTIGTTGLRQLGVQEINIIDMIKPVTKYAVMVTEPNTIKYHLQKAIHLATTGRPGPVWVDIPANIQNGKINEDELIDFNPNEIPVKTDPKFAVKVNEVATLLKKAKRPLLLAGHGVRLAGANDEFIKLAEQHQIPLTTSWNGDDVVNSDHDLFIGRPGAFASRGVNFAVQNADLLVSVGSRLPFMITGYNSKDFARNARIVMVDIDQSELDKSFLKLYSKIRSDAKDFLVALNQQLANDSFQAPQEWLEHCQNLKQKYPVILPKYKDQKGSVNSYHFIDLLSDLLHSDDVVVTDMGLSFVGTHQAFRVKKDQRFYTNSGFAPMGWGLPAAVGACIAHGKQRTIC
ncbi:MAG TPA: thiamine pyrophosphate-binding protein, partial [Sulfurimonas sp.]|nr:thiamine pyrophosphate-binding protein [Sulfurimonas sp.]